MKRCKGNCGRNVNLMGGDYCDKCKSNLNLRDKVIEDMKNPFNSATQDCARVIL